MKVPVFLSIVIPARNEEGSVKKLYLEIVSVIKKLRIGYEIVFIDDGSTDNTFKILENLHTENKRVKAIKLRGGFGKSIALQTGFRYAKGKVIITMDADLQDDPKEIPHFLKKIREGYDLVSGWKKVRRDPVSKMIPSRLGNVATRLLTGIKIHDLNCGFKAYRREVTENLNLYGELYKYIPVLAEKQNFRVAEITVSHRARIYGKSKFGWERNVKGFLDMLTVVFLTGYLKRPAHFFGTFGILSFFVGFVIGLYITYLRITTGGIQYKTPLLIFGVLAMIIGIQLITTGLLAEMITSYNQSRAEPESYITKVL